MKSERRHEAKRSSGRNALSISWADAAGFTHAADVQPLSTSRFGLAFESGVEIPVDTVVYIAAHDSFPAGYSLVRDCRWNGDNYTIDVEPDETPRQPAASASADSQNYYEFLQISPAAQAGTIHRVFRYLAGPYHPD